VARREPQTARQLRRAIGIITPSANIVVERMAIRLMRAFGEVDIHFARIPVSGSLDPHPDGYDWLAFENAAALLADAEPGVIVWAGSKGVLIGIDKDLELKQRIEALTALPFTSSSLGLANLATAGGLNRIGLVTPYTGAYQRRLIAGFGRMGIECSGEAHAGIADNLAYAGIGGEQIAQMARIAATGNPGAILGWCTNFAAGEVAAGIERETGIPFYDATLLALWDALGHLGVERTAGASWGRLFNS
jgi:maleate isomerase